MIAGLGAVLLGLPAAWAATADLEAATEELFTGQSSTLTLQVIGADPGAIPTIEAPAGLEVRFVGQSQMMSIIQGKAEQRFEFQYQIGSNKPDLYTIGPARVRLRNGTELVSDTEAVRIRQAPTVQGLDERFLVDTSISPARAWQGQVLTLRYGWQSRSAVVSTDWFGLPSDGIVLVRDAAPQRREYAVDDPSGRIWFDQTTAAVLAVRSGPLHWDAPIARMDVPVQRQNRRNMPFAGLFQQTERFDVRGDALDVEILPLPAPPADFSGLVGDFVLESRLDEARARVGASVEWRLELVGDGTTESFKAPAPPELANARVYDATPEAKGALLEEGWKGFVTLRRTIVPTAEGRLTLPEVRVVTFSPTQGAYVTLTAPARELWVRPGEAGEVGLTTFAPDEAPAEIAVDPNQLRPAWTSGAGTALPWRAVGPWALGLAAVPSVAPLAAGALAALRRRRAALAAPQEAGPLDLLAVLPDETAARLAALDAALRLALMRSSGEPDPRAAAANLAQPLAESTLGLLRSLDLARFAGKAPPDGLDADVRRVVEAILAAAPDHPAPPAEGA